MPLEKSQSKKLVITLIWLSLLTGTLDAMAALIWNYKASPVIIFEYIASGVFGRSAFAGGAPMVLWGVLFHYIIASSFTIVFYLLYPRFYRIFRNKYIIALEFGVITWFVMNLAVVPLSRIGFKPFLHLIPILTGMLILVICIGLPVALTADPRKKQA
ncbi:MAG TPA: hypothetical protein VHA56_07575 [Mucilaginibacter sp.]|nr:hypothetical protein [Mucilaginibacter sp.]